MVHFPSLHIPGSFHNQGSHSAQMQASAGACAGSVLIKGIVAFEFVVVVVVVTAFWPVHVCGVFSIICHLTSSLNQGSHTAQTQARAGACAGPSPQPAVHWLAWRLSYQTLSSSHNQGSHTAQTQASAGACAGPSPQPAVQWPAWPICCKGPFSRVLHLRCRTTSG